ncbi:MAG: hypothetical protein ACYTFG_16340, partial [Planctomycetota bacterium]
MMSRAKENAEYLDSERCADFKRWADLEAKRDDESCRECAKRYFEAGVHRPFEEDDEWDLTYQETSAYWPEEMCDEHLMDELEFYELCIKLGKGDPDFEG